MKNKVLLSIVSGLLLGLTSIGTAPSSGHLETDDLITLDVQPTASIMELAPRYETSGTFLSEVYEADNEFQLLGLNWHEELPAGTAGNMEIRFRDSFGNWTGWQDIEADQDGAYEGEGFWTYIITGDSDAFQYRAFLSTEDNGVTPKLSNISFDYVNGGRESGISKLGNGLEKLIFKKDDKIVARDDWGADENYRVSKNDLALSSDEKDDEEEDDDPIKIIKTVEEDESGDPLLWPLEYPNEVDKIIIHHTATTADLDDPEQAIRAIYYYHAISRGWGDIGYNFIIAPDGGIYEGRYGGDGVVGGHAAGYNTGSVGIAVLGNYEEGPISGEAIQSLTALIYEKAGLHGIDPDGYSTFHEDHMANIVGHNGVGKTACPGDYIDELLPDIRRIVDASLDNRRHTNYDTAYSYEELTSLELITLDPQDAAGVSIKIKNTGSQTWNSSTFITTNANYEADEVVDIAKDENKAVAKMKESSVSPGGTATFVFSLSSNLKGGLAHFDVSPIFNGAKKTRHYMDLGVYVETPYIAFDLAADSAPSVMDPNESASVTVTLKNEGNVIWKKSGDNKVTLKRSGSSDLVSSAELATLEESEVKPGGEGTFKFKINAPPSSGTYKLYFKPEMAGGNVLSNSSAQLSVKVSGSSTGSDEDAEFTGASNSDEELTFSPSQNKMLWMKIKNTSKENWYNSGGASSGRVTISVSGDEELELGKPTITLKTIKPGVTTKVYFEVLAPEQSGEYSLTVQAKLDGENLTDKPYEMEIKVDDTVMSASEYDNSIRIKLTPDKEIAPVITANSGFVLYDNEEVLKIFPSETRVRVTPTAGQYRITSGSYVWLVGGPVRITANSASGIVRVLSISQLASWDNTINDNKFRGTIEVRMLDSNGDGTEEINIINELPLEEYLQGLAEETNTTPTEKLKAMAILARSYAYYYMTRAEKFPGLPYHLEDDPNTSQKYLGYNYERRHPNVAKAVKETAGTVVTYKGALIKTPYFSRSDGVATKSAQEVWGWTNTPYLVSVPDTQCDSDEFWGHGVGLSGCGAKALAEQGYTFEEIIKYYFTGVELDQL